MKLPAKKNEVAKKSKSRKAVRRDPFAGIASFALTKDQQLLLTAKVDESLLEVKATGEVYLPHIYYRTILDNVFGVAGWGLRPLQKGWTMNEDILYREYALYANGKFISAAMGEAEYIKNNPRMTYGDAAEALRSNALVRCCKDLGIARECWNRRFTNEWREKYAVAIVVNTSQGSKIYWRRKNSASMKGEIREATAEEIKQNRVIPQQPGEKKNNPPANNFQPEVTKDTWEKFLDEMKRVKEAIGASDYYNTLGRFGYEKANLIKKDRKVMTEIYRALIAVAEGRGIKL